MTLHLTRIEIDYETALRVLGIPDAYAWHQWAWKAFPDRPKAHRDFLTRLDDTGEGFRFLVQSPSRPTKPPNCPDPAWETKVIPESFFDHHQFRFSLLANPTKKVRSNEKGERLKNSRRVPIYFDRQTKSEPATRIDVRAALIAWLARQAERHGFRFDSDTLKTVSRPRQVFTKKGRLDDRRHAGIHAATEFIGTLEVTDHEAFRHAVVNGIGSAKAFGFGMLCLAPISSDDH